MHSWLILNRLGPSICSRTCQGKPGAKPGQKRAFVRQMVSCRAVFVGHLPGGMIHSKLGTFQRQLSSAISYILEIHIDRLYYPIYPMLSLMLSNAIHLPQSTGYALLCVSMRMQLGTLECAPFASHRIESTYPSKLYLAIFSKLFLGTASTPMPNLRS